MGTLQSAVRAEAVGALAMDTLPIAATRMFGAESFFRPGSSPRELPAGKTSLAPALVAKRATRDCDGARSLAAVRMVHGHFVWEEAASQYATTILESLRSSRSWS